MNNYNKSYYEEIDDIQNVVMKDYHISGICYKFNFGNEPKKGYTSVIYDENNGVPFYESYLGYGFVNETCAYPARKVHTSQITSSGNGFEISEPEFYAEPEHEKDNYNNLGMAFRVDVPIGAYQIYVKTTSDEEDTVVSVSGMQAERILKGGFWDAARLVPIRNTAAAKGKEWTYKYVNVQGFIDIEIEPKKENVPVGVEEIVLRYIAPEARLGGMLPTIYILGDSTAKSYTFDEAPMSSWGQVFHNMFDLDKVNVINYSMGGRSFKSAYTEGRLNDILLSGKIGDYVLVQSGHNDESMDENRRFGRGNTEESYEAYIRKVYIPAIKSRGMIPILVTPMSRVKGNAEIGHIYTNSFNNRRFPDIMKKAAAELGIMLIDLNAESVNYYNEIGVEATTAIYMSIEAGETPGKTNDGSYANGHPANKIDGTHYKEALAKQFARIIVTEFAKKAKAGDNIAEEVAYYLKEEVKNAIDDNDWTRVFPEMAKDTTTGAGAYYRNQIEKLIQLGVLHKDINGNFNPDADISVKEYIEAISKLTSVGKALFSGYADGVLTREVMGAILYDVYQAKFCSRPKFMTDYNGTALTPDDLEYDPNLDSGARGIMYYPMVSYDQLEDRNDISPGLFHKVKKAYDLGLIRSENGIERGKVVNGTLFQPKARVSKAKAAKTLYYMWVLIHPVNVENDLSVISYLGGEYNGK